MEQLSGLDAAFLALETPTAPLHVGAIGVLDPKSAMNGFSIESVKTLISSRIHLAPFLRKRLVRVAMDLDFPYFADDPHFDLDHHIRHLAVPQPGTWASFVKLAEQIHTWPLHRDRPLWEFYLVEGLENGKWGFIFKVHHAAIDGASGAAMAAVLLDMMPLPRKVPPPKQEYQPKSLPDGIGLLAKRYLQVVDEAQRGGGLAALLPRAFGLAQQFQNQYSDVFASMMPMLFDAPKTPLNVAVSSGRRFITFSYPQKDLEKLRALVPGSKLNDIVLAICAGALRRWLLRQGQLPGDPLSVVMPINIRTDGNDIGGNQLAAMILHLATHEADPAQRLALIHQASLEAKAKHQAMGGSLLKDVAKAIIPAMSQFVAQQYNQLRMADRHRPLVNLVISNVPGPPVPMYFNGCKLESIYPLGPVYDGLALNVTVFSYRNQFFFGLNACKNTLVDAEELANDFNQSFAELLEALNRPTPEPEPLPPVSSSPQSKLRTKSVRTAKGNSPRKTSEPQLETTPGSL